MGTARVMPYRSRSLTPLIFTTLYSLKILALAPFTDNYTLIEGFILSHIVFFTAAFIVWYIYSANKNPYFEEEFKQKYIVRHSNFFFGKLLGITDTLFEILGLPAPQLFKRFIAILIYVYVVLFLAPFSLFGYHLTLFKPPLFFYRANDMERLLFFHSFCVICCHYDFIRSLTP